MKRFDHDLGGSLDEQRVMFYSGGWQLLEERVYDGWTPGSPGSVDRIIQNVWGELRGRYIDDIMMRRYDNDADGTYGEAGEDEHFYLTDHQFSVVAIIDDVAALVERVTYDAFGEAQHSRAGDVNGDGIVGTADNAAILAAWGNPVYGNKADLNRDGQVGSADLAIYSATYGGAAKGVLSEVSAGGNIFGYCGYVFNAEVGSGGVYTVRFRHYDPGVGVGRWLERDPAGYMDSMNLYGYGASIPNRGMDPLGLIPSPTHALAAYKAAKAAWNWLWGSSPSATRVRGIGGVAQGVTEVAIGSVLTTNGVAFAPATGGISLLLAIPGGFLIIHGVDEGSASVVQVLTGKQQYTYLFQILEQWTGSATAAGWLEAAMVVAASGGGGYALYAIKTIRGAGALAGLSARKILPKANVPAGMKPEGPWPAILSKDGKIFVDLFHWPATERAGGIKNVAKSGRVRLDAEGNVIECTWD